MPSREFYSERGGGSFLLDFAPALAYVALVFYLGSIPMPALPEVSSIGTDKLGHCAAFLGMAVVFVRAGDYLRPSLPESHLRWFAALGATLTGGLLEIYQLAVPGRSADVLDWAADGVGALLAALLVRSRWVVARRSPRDVA